MLEVKSFEANPSGLSPGYTALHESAAWLDLSGRGKIRATGKDRVRLFHSMMSNDVKGLRPGQGNYHFLLNAQGRIQADLNLYLFSDCILLDSDPSLAGRIEAHLKKYIIADDVKLENITNTLATIGIEGPQAASVAGIAVPPEPNSHVEAEGMIVARSSLTGQPGFWFFLEPARRQELIRRLEAAGAVAATAGDAEVVRVENGRPRFGDDFGEMTLPQETCQMRALHFNKGCYLGQEIVERIRSRGQIHKLLVRIAVEGQAPPEHGSPVVAGGQEVGKLTSPVYSPRHGCCLGLAIIRREFSQPETPVTVAGRPARVLELHAPPA
jgi:folate-binding protein YgfZ